MKDVCKICNKEFFNHKSMTNHRRHHNKAFSSRWSKKMDSVRRKPKPKWVGKKISQSLRTFVTTALGARARARYDFGKGICELCGNKNGEIHHKDNNPFNNNIDNIQHVCRKHHMEIDGRLAKLIEAGKKATLRRMGVYSN